MENAGSGLSPSGTTSAPHFGNCWNIRRRACTDMGPLCSDVFKNGWEKDEPRDES